MHYRRFTDRRGIEWRVWRATSDPASRGAGAYAPPERCPGGALCFESPFERRYVLTYPNPWDRLSDAELDLLCGQAQVVPIRQADEATGEFMRRQDEHFEATLGRRTFATPDNRVWLVEECPAPVPAEESEAIEGAQPAPAGDEPSRSKARRVLRFISGDTLRELDEYPADWGRYPPGKLVQLALRARPVSAAPSPKHSSSASPQRGAST